MVKRDDCELSEELLKSIQKDPGIVEGILFDEFDNYLAPWTWWHGVHYLLTGTAWETPGDVGLAILGGECVGPSRGLNPVRLLSPDQVRRITAALSMIDEDALMANYDPARFQELEIYPNIWNEEDRQCLLDDFQELAKFYATAAANGNAILLDLN